MSSRLRIRVATALVGFVLVWPGVQHLLSRSLESDPWSFFGFAMYAVPNFKLTVRAGALEAPDAEPDWNAIPVSSYALLREYGERRARYGKLLPPDAVARELLARHPELPGVVLRIRRWRIAPHGSRIEAVDTDSFHPRVASP